jgi:UDP-N-acetylmuramyl pentapeptide phosphotransferase/UDP-N-acetylglucosamine-1-phosphate transferase
MKLALAVLAFAISAWLTRRLCNPVSRLYMLDHPNVRSLHARPTPRGGGLAIFVAIAVSAAVVATLYGAPRDVAWIALAAVLIAGVSFVDDWLTISLGYRIVMHFAAGGLLLWGGFALHGLALPGIAWPLSIPLALGLSLLFVVWMVNLYNFMDGMDGLAAGMAVVGFGSFAIFGWLAEQQLFAAWNLIVASAAGGFLLFNFPPARIFMGDIGSSLLGFLAATFMLWADRDDIFPLWVGVLVFSPFIVDATVTLIKRILGKDKFWEAHKTHYYQRLVQLGWGHKRTVLWEYAVMLLCAVSALIARYLTPSGQWIMIAMWLLTYLVIVIVVHQLEARRDAIMTR